MPSPKVWFACCDGEVLFASTASADSSKAPEATSMFHSFALCSGIANSSKSATAASSFSTRFLSRYSGDFIFARCLLCAARHASLSQSTVHPTVIVGKKSVSALYPKYMVTVPKLSRNFRLFCTSIPATMPIVVGSDAAHTPSRFSVFSSIPLATTSGGTHAKHAVDPGIMTWICPETASSETPLSIQVCSNSRHAWLIACRAS
mmetsp:Transcript_13556/g.50754  ORF Transcript_13556/g.50754 Transcript_13556/m.50754 type:complete len:204 (+) Transcript_13556:190-801(+)